MHDPALDATFEAIELKDGSVGYVSLARPEMPQRIGEFKPQTGAREWIGVKSAKWLMRYGELALRELRLPDRVDDPAHDRHP